MTPGLGWKRLFGTSSHSETGDQPPVPLDVVVLHVVEQPAAAANEHEEPTTTVMVFLVDLQVLGEVVDPLGQERNLDLGRARVGRVGPVLGDRGRLVGHEG